jgi:nitric oxide reductase NorQ protein
MSKSTERLPSEAFAPNKDLVYVDTNELHDLYGKLAFRSNLVLVGPKGIGKSLSLASFAGKEDCPILTFDCSEDVRRSHLLGMFVLRGNETPFVLGPLSTAFEVANEVGQAILVLEEINALSPQMQKVLNSSLDFRRRIEVPEAGAVFQLNPGAKLWITGTMNTAVYGGVYELNEDLKSRVRLVPMDYPEVAQEQTILAEVLKAQGLTVDPRVVNHVLTLAHETRQKAMDYALSTRDVVQVLEDSVYVGLNKALWLVSGKFEGEDRSTIAERVQSIFGIDIAA